jgi:hypothetical protein
MASMKEELERQETNWASKGCGDEGLLGEWELFCAKCYTVKEPKMVYIVT